MKKNLVYIGNHLRNSNKNPTYSLELITRLRAAGYSVVETSGRSNKLQRYLDMWTTLFKHRKRCDYVLIDTYSTWNFYYAITLAWWARRFGLKYIPVLHGGNLPQRLKKNPKAIERYCKGAYKVISPSAYLAKEFQKAGMNNILIIPNAIDLQQFPFKENASGGQRIIWLRSFIELYNPQLAIKAFKLVKDRFPEAEMTMAGPADENSLQHCKNLAKNLDLQIDFRAKQSRSEWITLAQQHDIFLNSSNFDNMPLSVIEAMAMGLVVVSTDVGGMPYLIENEDSGLLVAADEPEQMAMAITKLLTDNGMMSELAIKARSRVTDYNWQAVMNKWKAVLN